MAEYRLENTQTHYLWNVDHKPVLTIKSGDTVTFETAEVTSDSLTIDSTTEDVAKLDYDLFYPLTGPVYIEGAEPGDTLAVEILNITPKNWGWMCTLPGMGLLPERFPDGYLRTFDISNGEYVPFPGDIKVPFDPFLGTMGVCPAGAEGQSVMPPGAFGGNMDLRHLRKGATVFFPVEVAGALFSCGDGHAVQGDGEICVTALECPVTAELKFTLIKGKAGQSVSFFTPSPLLPKIDICGWQGTTGFGPDLMAAAKDAMSRMVDFVLEKTDLEPYDAYLLCSLAADLKITEIVDSGVWIVTAMIPLSIFGE
ncbi:MAG: acetamidase/formamidase family protein [Lachnospiraceae bacterium]|nr:acetamidase/formamidase family protein [Lachnospiraceae bacterium]